MALVLMGGLFVSTFLTAVLLPTTATLSKDLLGWIGKLGWIGRAPGRLWRRLRGRSRPRRMVCTLLSGLQPAGEHTVHWDGRSQSGARLTNGVYFIRLVCPDRMDTRRVAVIH